MNYYYLASSLPTISMDASPAISFDEFMDTCEEHLTESDMSTLRAISNPDAPESSHHFITAWQAQETVLRNTLTRLRAIKLNLDASLFTKNTDHSDLHTEKVIGDAYTHGTPLEREEAIDKLRWSQADELAGFDPFSPEAIFSYGLQLKLAERWAALDEEKAESSADIIINTNPEKKEQDER